MSLLSDEKILELAHRRATKVRNDIEAAVLEAQSEQEPVASLYKWQMAATGTLMLTDSPPDDGEAFDGYEEIPVFAAPIIANANVQPDCRAIANQIVSNLEGRKRVIDLDLEEALVEEIMQEMEDTIRAMIATTKEKK